MVVVPWVAIRKKNLCCQSWTRSSSMLNNNEHWGTQQDQFALEQMVLFFPKATPVSLVFFFCCKKSNPSFLVTCVRSNLVGGERVSVSWHGAAAHRHSVPDAAVQIVAAWKERRKRDQLKLCNRDKCCRKRAWHWHHAFSFNPMNVLHCVTAK